MPNPITTLLQRTAEGIGGVKLARRPSPNRINYWPADEMNRALDGLALISQWLGLSDGSTPDSIFQLLRSVSGPRSSRFRMFDDFVSTDVASGALYQTSSAGGSTCGLVPAPNEVGGGCGILSMVAANAVSAFVSVDGNTVAVLRGSQLPSLAVRFKTPAAFVGADLRIGIGEYADASYARIRLNGTAVVSIETKSATGGGTGSVATSVSLAASTWYELRIVIGVGRVDYYINDALVGSETTAARVPVAGDPLGIFRFRIDRTSAGPHTLLIDWFELAATRL